METEGNGLELATYVFQAAGLGSGIFRNLNFEDNPATFSSALLASGGHGENGDPLHEP